MKYAVIASTAVLVIATAMLGVGLYFKTQVDADNRAALLERQKQFCTLVLNMHRDKEKRVENTHQYLATAVGRERTALNSYIRNVSLPQLEKEVADERKNIPEHCLEE